MEWSEYRSWHCSGAEWGEHGPRHFEGRQLADGYQPEWFRGPRYDQRREHFDGRQGPEGRQRFDGQRHPEGKKPEMKKPAAKKPEMKLGGDKQNFEFRLAALERQQAEILSLLRVVASEHKSKELAKGGKDLRHNERKPHHDDRD